MRTRYLKGMIGEAEVTCTCQCTNGSPGSFDEPAEAPEIDVLEVETVDGRMIQDRLTVKAYDKLYDYLYENFEEDYDE